MFSILPNLIARLKILLLTFLVAELEADLIAAAAERKAELLRQAGLYEKADMPGVANQLRKQAESIGLDKPLASVAAAVAHLRTDPTPDKVEDSPLPPPSSEAPSQPGSKKKKA